MDALLIDCAVNFNSVAVCSTNGLCQAKMTAMNLRNSTNKNRNNLALLRSQGLALEGGHPTTKQTLFYEDIYIYIYIYIYIWRFKRRVQTLYMIS